MPTRLHKATTIMYSSRSILGTTSVVAVNEFLPWKKTVFVNLPGGPWRTTTIGFSTRSPFNFETRISLCVRVLFTTFIIWKFTVGHFTTAQPTNGTEHTNNGYCYITFKKNILKKNSA